MVSVAPPRVTVTPVSLPAPSAASAVTPVLKGSLPRAAAIETDDPFALGEALYARINPRYELSEPARRYAYSTPVDMAKELLTLRGESTMALSPASLVTRALHTT